jgi:hypothetical protein
MVACEQASVRSASCESVERASAPLAAWPVPVVAWPGRKASVYVTKPDSPTIRWVCSA